MNDAENTIPTRNTWLRFLPLGAFLLLSLVFLIRMLSDTANSNIPSALLGKPVPEFSVTALEGLRGPDGKPIGGFDTAYLVRSQKPILLNVWASWCVPCRDEHPVLMRLAQDKRVELVGLNYKDVDGNALRFLGGLGNPFTRVGVDPKGRTSIEWGVYGIPETFLISSDGLVTYKHVGPLNADSLGKLEAEIEKAL